MKVKVKVGSEVILDSSKKQVAKVIEPPQPVTEKPKQNTTMVVNKPKDAIFNKVEEKPEEAPKDINEWAESYHEKEEEEVVVELEDKVEVTSELDLEVPEYDEEEDDVEEYDQYLSNRDRNEIRKEKKQQNKRNTNFGEF